MPASGREPMNTIGYIGQPAPSTPAMRTLQSFVLSEPMTASISAHSIDLLHLPKDGLSYLGKKDGKMAEIQVQLAHDEDDIKAARKLCQEWIDWHWENYPTDWPTGAGHPMDRENFQTIIENLPELHQRPSGGILIATVAAKPVGCVMYSEQSPGVAEFKRMFVSVAGRGNGLGRKMLESMFEQMVADGYKKVFFSSATFLTHARSMYEKAGFVTMLHPQGFPDGWRDKVYFMERSLV
jgi:GNAT superfamily N-acetyltransferase